MIIPWFRSKCFQSPILHCETIESKYLFRSSIQPIGNLAQIYSNLSQSILYGVGGLNDTGFPKYSPTPYLGYYP